MVIPATIAGIATWKLIMAAVGAGLLAKTGTDLTLGLRGLGIQEKGIQAGLMGQEMQATIGKREEARSDKLMKQLLSHKRGERKEDREMEALRYLMGSKNQQSAMMMAAMQMIGQNRPQRSAKTFPPSSIVSLLQ